VLQIRPKFRDFADTAGALASLDAVISVDTAVAHLAGAMGKPLFLLLPFAADFRWLRERYDSPWYPSARLCRQPAFGDWDGAVEALRQELTRFVRHPDVRAKRASKDDGPGRASFEGRFAATSG
jgi:ADP-heptose:LPS heptosyltransferase